MLLPTSVKSASEGTPQPPTQLSIQAPIQHINCVTHEGKVVLVGTDAAGKLWYTVKQDGFEDSYLQKPEAERTGWEDWQLLTLPNEADDQSVVDKERAEFTKQDETYLLRSLYTTHDQSAVAPVQLVSALGYIYVFRQSKSNTLLVDRFILDGLTNTLNRKLDIRFKRSRQKHKPIQSQRKGDRGLLNVDALDFTDIQGNPFYEPSTELSLIDNLCEGWFSVVLLPTAEQDKYRWHIFACNCDTKTVEITSLRASEEGLFDVKDYTILEPEPRKISGIIKRTLDLGSGVTVANSITATRYDVQRERETEAKDNKGKVVWQLLRESVRVMLVVGTNRGPAIALSFAVAADGTLSKIANNPESKQICRSLTRQVLLPPDTLKALAQEGTNREGMTFDGTEDYIALPPMNHDFSQGFTVEALVYFDSLKPQSKIVDFGNGADAENIILGSSNTPSALGFSVGRDYDLQLFGSGGSNALPASGKRLIAIARDAQNPLSLKIFDAQGRLVFSSQGATLSNAEPAKINTLKSLLKPYWNTSAAAIPQEDKKKIVEAVRVALPTISTKDQQSIEVADVLEAGKWIHVAATINQDGKVTLYKNGEAIKTDTFRLPPTLKRDQNYIGKSNSTPGSYLQGKLREVRIWNRACDANEVKNGMSLPLRGKEAGLVGYWRLDAIADGTIIDFSVSGNDGTVIGDAYVSSVILSKQEGITEYLNGDLFAVTKGATYTEEFEFKPTGTVSELTFIYKGKKSRSSKDWVEKALEANITSLSNGWYKAECEEFKVPNDVSLLRSFGISNIKGDWTQLEIRKHRIILVSDSITAETYNDTPDPNKLQITTATTPTRNDRWQKLNALEQAEGILLRRKQNLERVKRTKLPSPSSSEITTSETNVQNLQKAVNNFESEYNDYINNPFNFWCYIVAKHSNRGIEAVANQWENGAGIKQGQEVNDSNKGHWGLQWKFEPVGDGCYKIVGRYASALCLHVSGTDKTMTHARIDQYTWANVDWQKWRVEKLSDGSYKIFSKHSPSKGLDVSGQYTHDGAVIQLFPCTDNAPSRTWWIRTGDALDSRFVSDRKRAFDAKRAELNQARETLQQLKDRQDTEPKLRVVDEQLQSVQTTIRKLKDQGKAAPIEMKLVATDDRQLATQGAVLDFVRPASRLNAIETCEGAVQLSYFDADGRMRQTHFDATADRQNATFEEWIPDDQPTCLHFEAASSIVTLEKPINLDTEWTVEAWFFYPFRAVDDEFAPNQWTVLVGGGKRQPIVVRDGKHLGTRFDDRFYSSGYDLENLTVGWHHVTAVGKPSDMGSKTLFYIDGEAVGEAVSTAALVLNGKDTFLDCGSKIDLKDKSFTIEFWAKRTTTGTAGQYHFIVSQGAEETNKGLHIGFRDNNKFTFAFYGGSDLDTAPFTDLDWHHWACVYDAATKKQQIYRDGQLVVERTATANYTGIGNLFVGKAWAHNKFNGQLNELRIWNRALTPLEISTNWDKTSTADKDLLGWWQFDLDKNDKAVATDRSAQRATATLGGDPKVESSPAAIAINQIGNASPANQQSTNQPASNQQAGKLAEIRVWQVALSPTEITVNSKTLLSGNEPDLVAYYPLNEGTGNVVRNQTGDSNDGTVVNESWQACALPVGNLGDLVIHQAMVFYGNPGCIELPLTGHVLSADFTVEAWIRPLSFPTVGGQSPENDITILGTDSHETNKGLHLVIRDRKPFFGFYGGADYDTPGRKSLTKDTWYHICFRYDSKSKEQAIFVNGELDNKSQGNRNPFQGVGTLKIGSSRGSGYFTGCIAELCIWNKALTTDEIQLNKCQRLMYKKPGLVAYYPLNDFRLSEHPQYATDLVSNQRVSVTGSRVLSVEVTEAPAPMRDALISCEYSTVSKDRSAMMRRFFATPSPQGVQLLPDKRIEQLELQWIGNGQFAPTLLGYIEGAPPIPTENLTLENNYNGATSVELAVSEDVEFKWRRSQDAGLGVKSEGFLGIDTESYVGVGAQTKAQEYRSGAKGALETDYKFQNETSISSKSSLSMTDKLKLSGTQEQILYFPHLGKRFIPKNVGYALVVSALADVFITRLKRTGKMVGYQVLPVENIPPDVNTITFLINPAYTMSGSLDGMTGSSATSQRFFKHVPEMRARFGSLYPASYYRLKEAYDLKEKIDKQDKDRESYFSHFNSRLVDETSLGREIDKGEAPGDVSLSREEEQPNTDADLTEEQKKAAEEKRRRKLEQEAATAQAKQSDAVKNKQKEIDKQIKDPNLRANASASFVRWQKRMEDIQIRAGKRNIVNTYVWDADGGLRAEAQSFANTAEHSIGGSFSMNASLGWDTKMGLFGAAMELTAQATVSLTQTMSKTETRSKGIQLNVDLSGVESRGITNHDDLPLLAGERVNRYRFMSFYLEGSTNHFHDFFSYVVDPEWLAGNSEEARALRQARGKANKAWRVLHRVTYVERPALAGFGRDVRELPPAISEEEQQIALLKEQVATLEDKLDQILQLLNPNNSVS